MLARSQFYIKKNYEAGLAIKIKSTFQLEENTKEINKKDLRFVRLNLSSLNKVDIPWTKSTDAKWSKIDVVLPSKSNCLL